MSKEVNTNIKKFINQIINKNYKSAHKDLSSSINGKIKQQIINNNIDLF
jgi:hypothetical protein